MRKKILIPTFYKNYGGSVFILLKCAEILKKDFDVIVKAPLKEADINNFSIPPTIKKKEQIKLSFHFISHFLKELNWIIKNRFDIIYVHDEPSLYIYGLIGKILSIPVIWHAHNSNKKKIHRKRNFFFSDKRIYVAKFLIPDFDKNYTFIPCYIENFNLLKKNDKKIKNIVVAGSICERKNQKFAVKFIKKLNNPDIKLYLFGDVIEREYFNELEIDNKQIIYKGFENKRKILKLADLVFMPSKEESLGLIFLEALANNIPALIPNIPATQEVAKIIGYENFLYKKNDLEDCLKKFELLKNLNIHEIQKNVLRFYSIETFEKRILEFFKNV